MRLPFAPFGLPLGDGSGSMYGCDYGWPYSHLTRIDIGGDVSPELKQQMDILLSQNKMREERGEMSPPMPDILNAKFPPPENYEPETTIETPEYKGKTLEDKMRDWREQGI